MDYDIWHYSSRVLHAHYIHVKGYIDDLISHDLVFCYSRWYLTCQFILLSDLFTHSSALLILPLYFHIFIFTFPLFVCTLAGSLLTDLDFLASELEETDPLFEGTQED